jgi:hypothetical protein
LLMFYSLSYGIHITCSLFLKASMLWLQLPSLYDILHYVCLSFKLKISLPQCCLSWAFPSVRYIWD